MHDRWAQEIAGGNVWGHEVFFRAPLYYYFLALIYYLFGHNYFIPRLIQIALGAFSTWLTYRLGWRLFGEKEGVIAGVIYALCGPIIYFDADLLIPALLLPLILLTLLQLDRQRENPTTGGFLLAGLMLGLSALARPNILVFIPFVWIWILWVNQGKTKWALVFSAGVVLMISPVTLRNWLVGKDFVPISSQAGVNFYIGNNPQSDGYTAIVPGTPGDWEGGYNATIRIAREALGADARPSQISGYWFRRALKEMSARPARWVDLTLKKARLLLSGHEIGNNEDIYFQRRFSPILRLLMWEKVIAFPFGTLLPLGFLGLALSWQWRKNSLLLFFFISYALSIIAFFVCTRYRLPLIPILAIWSSAAIVELYRMAKRGNARQYLVVLIGFVLLFFAVNQNPMAAVGITGFEGAYYLGNKYYDEKQYGKALDAYREAVALDSTSGRARNGMAMALLGLGQKSEARNELEKAVLLDPSLIQARNNLGQLLLQDGELEEAGKRFSEVLELDSVNTFAQQGLADVALERGDYALAEDHFRRAYELGLANRQVISRWALALMKQGKYAQALEVNARLLALELDNARAHHNQARLYMACDSLDQAARELEVVLRLAPNNTEARQQLQEIRQQASRK